MTAAASGRSTDARYARVAVEVEPYHLDRPFDYAIPDDPECPVQVGSRVEVVFAGRRRRGLVLELCDTTEVEPARIRPLRRVFGPHRWLEPDDIEVARWAAERYGAPLADVIRHALPDRVVDVERRGAVAGWFPPGTRPPPGAPPAPEDLDESWGPYGAEGEGLRTAVAAGAGAFYWRPLPGEDLGVRLAELVRLTLAGGRDVIVVVPDPASPTGRAVVAAAGDLVVDVRGGPGKRRVYDAWLRARCGDARVVVGERGVALWPVRRLGLAVVVDEANPALKERRSPRHHAREVLLERARRAGGVGLLVGYVPSAPAWRLLTSRRLVPITPQRRVERDRAPQVLADAQAGEIRTRIGAPALEALRRALGAGRYGVVLAARRGEGRSPVCRRCGTRVDCPSCGGAVALTGHELRCPTCGWSSRRRACVECGAQELVPLAAGTERVAEELRRSLDGPVAVLEGYAATPPPPPAVLVMTRGSVLDQPPGPVGGVVLPDFDGQLRRPSLNAAEDALRISMQVASWAAAIPEEDRATGPAVVVQTREPGHHAVQALVRWDPGGFWRAESEVRAPLRFPPVATAITVLAPDASVADGLRAALPAEDELLGPVPMDGQVEFLVKSSDRIATVAALDEARRRWSADGVDVRLDVEPVG